MNPTLNAIIALINRIRGKESLGSILGQFTKAHAKLGRFQAQADVAHKKNTARQAALVRRNAAIAAEMESAAKIRSKLAEFVPNA